MKFYARLRRVSSLHSDWRMHNRLSGYVDGIFFQLRGFDFVTEELTQEQINKIKARQDQAIEVQMISTTPEILKEEPVVASEPLPIETMKEEPPLKRPRLRRQN
jgi:hypothetical protein